MALHWPTAWKETTPYPVALIVKEKNVLDYATSLK